MSEPMTENDHTIDSREDERVDCPKANCGIEMNTRTELNSHLRWDHNHTEGEAEALLDAAGVERNA